jgi:TPR repeat protein
MKKIFCIIAVLLFVTYLYADPAEDIYKNAQIALRNKQYSLGKKYLEQSAKMGNNNAIYAIGIAFYYGFWDFAKDTKNGVVFFEKAANNNHIMAQYYMGVALSTGDGIVQNYKDAYNWYLKSANQLYAPAMLELGKYNYNGFGIKKNLVEAHKWYNLACVYSNDDNSTKDEALKMRNIVEKSLSMELINKAQSLANKWQSTRK